MHGKLIGLLLLEIFVAHLACAKRIPIPYEGLEINSEVKVETKSGTCYTGSVHTKNNDFLILLVNNNNTDSLQKINREEIQKIERTPPVYDDGGVIISEREIAQTKGRKNLYLFTLGGSGLSFGVSFFLASMIYRVTSGNDRTALWLATGIGTIAGTTFFSLQGNHRDRRMAIEHIKEQRKIKAMEKIEQERKRRLEVEMELRKLKQERERQNAEMKKLMEQIKKKETQKENSLPKPEEKPF